MQELEEKLIAEFNANQKEESKSFGAGAMTSATQVAVQQQASELEVLDEGGVEEVQLPQQQPVLKNQGSGNGMMKEDMLSIVKKVEEMKKASQSIVIESGQKQQSETAQTIPKTIS